MVAFKTWTAPPSLTPAYLRALLSARKRNVLPANTSVPRLEVVLGPQRPDGQMLAKYRKLCGFVDGPTLPLTYPQVLAGPLHIYLLTEPDFPLPALGVVHARQTIEQLQTIGIQDPLALRAWVEGHRDLSNGIEIDIQTEATLHDLVVWRSVTTIFCRKLSKSKGKGEQKVRPPTAVIAPYRSLVLRLPEDLGRRYSQLAGDYNPIHLHAIPAKLFGFRRAIAHGMWTLARAVAEVQQDVTATELQLQAQFKRPIFLPSKAVLAAARNGEAIDFTVESPDGASMYLVGQLAPLAKQN